METNESTAPVEKKTGLQLLREPFLPHQISVKPKPLNKDAQKGRCEECGGWHGLPAVHLSYVGHAALTDRLLDCDPEWSWEPLAFGPDGLPLFDKAGGLWIKLTVCGLTRLGYGDAQGKTGPDATKEVIGDALRNAAMRYGAALDLWHKGDLHGSQTDDDTGGESGQQPQSTRQPRTRAPAKSASQGESGASPEEIETQMQGATTVPELVKIMNGLSKETQAAVNKTFNRRMSELKKAA